MNVAEQKSAFMKAMADTQENREAELGKPTWRENVEAHGPSILYAELAGITGRLKALIWDKPDNVHYNYDKIEDLLVDLGNYTGFLYEHMREKREEIFGNAPPFGLRYDDGQFVDDNGAVIRRHGEATNDEATQALARVVREVGFSIGGH